jgi:chaperone modulatory protein CbpM
VNVRGPRIPAAGTARRRFGGGLDRGGLEAGWLEPRQAGPEHAFSEIDLARACLIRDLRDAIGVNDEGIAVVLDLLDQMHGLRHALRRLSGALHSVPEPLRREVLARLQGDTPAAGPAEDVPPGLG